MVVREVLATQGQPGPWHNNAESVVVKAATPRDDDVWVRPIPFNGDEVPPVAI
jgi:hypothetical protein